MNTNFRSTITAVAATICLSLPLAVSAVEIEGEIGFAGVFTPTGGTSIGDATGLDISSAFVLAATDDLAPTLGATATFTSFQFYPFLDPVPVMPLWTITVGATTFSFDLESIHIDLQNSTELNLSGQGTLMGTGYDDTDGNWVFTGNSLGTLFTFSSNTAPVPEPGTLALLGLGLFGVLRTRRR